jgi:hypothetical protein
MRLPRKSLLLLGGAAAIALASVLVTDCGAPDSRQYVGALVLPAVAAVCFGAAGWLWPVQATTGQRVAVGVFCGLLLGAIGWLVVAAFWAGGCEA